MNLGLPLRWMLKGLRESILLLFAVGLHLVVVILFLSAALPQTRHDTPQLHVTDVMVELSTVEADPTQSPPPAEPLAGQLPMPLPSDLPAFLNDPLGDVALPALTEAPPRLSEMEPLPLPEQSFPDTEHASLAIPEITLPPAEVCPVALAKGGATARIEHPALAVELASILKTYPKEALRRGHQGTVVLRIEINASNKVSAISVEQSSGSEILDRAAVKMLRTAPYVGGPGELTQVVRFAIKHD